MNSSINNIINTTGTLSLNTKAARKPIRIEPSHMEMASKAKPILVSPPALKIPTIAVQVKEFIKTYTDMENIIEER